jgi:hypothetical protein
MRFILTILLLILAFFFGIFVEHDFSIIDEVKVRIHAQELE